jgi:S1-C subfamily serine protease
VWLRIATGPDTGRWVEVTGELTLGRERGVDVVVRDERASRRHASVAPADGGIVLRDLGSANGTLVAGAPVGETHLVAGQRFVIGDTELEVMTERAPSEAAKRAAAAALLDAARATVTEKPPPPPTYSMIGRLIEQRTRGHRRATWAALGVAAVAVVLLVVLLVSGGDDDRVPEAVRALSPSTALVEVSRGGARTATGSGWVLDAGRGLIVTNAHVINAGDEVSVAVAGRKRPATVHAAAPCEDLALLRVRDTAGLRAAPLGGAVEQGQTVVALGYPADAGAGTTLAATTGVVSAARTSFRDPAPDVPAYPEVIQTDTALNPGNSGGPLADLEARIIGVNAAARTSGSDGRALQNQNYAIPIARARRVLDDLREQRSSAWLGVSFGYPSVEDLAEQELPPGLFLTGAVPGTPAAAAGLGANELLIGIEEREVGNTLAGYCEAAAELASGQTVSLLVRDADGGQRRVRVRMA